MVLKIRADMLEKIAKSRKKCVRWKKPEKEQKPSKMRNAEKYVQKTCFTAYFLYC